MSNNEKEAKHNKNFDGSNKNNEVTTSVVAKRIWGAAATAVAATID